MPIKTKYEKLVEENGVEAANAYMKELRSRVKHMPGGSFRNKDFAKAASLKGVEAKRKKREEASNTGQRPSQEEQ